MFDYVSYRVDKLSAEVQADTLVQCCYDYKNAVIELHFSYQGIYQIKL